MKNLKTLFFFIRTKCGRLGPRRDWSFTAWRRVFFTVLFCGAHAALADTSLSQIIQIASQKNIAESRAWKKLLHVEPNLIGFHITQITDPKFFLSNSPEYQIKDELIATLKGFLAPAEKFTERIADSRLKPGSEKVIDQSQHPICRFPARLKFLKSQLPEAANYWASLPEVHCVYQNIFLNAVDPVSVSFVFSSYYSDSPGSAFGHTFFRLNRRSPHGPSRQELLDYGVGYAANVTVSNAALYAILGLVGGFTGTWTNLPYYYKVREYNDFEARDLWSYDLNLTEDEVQTLALHLWEVGPHTYTYYFFTQNCAYHMLTMLEAAAPRLHLTDHVPFLYVIPSDSMKALFYEKDFVKSVGFRPSVRKKFTERYLRLADDQREDFKNYARTGHYPENFTRQPDQKQALFLDAAIDLFDLRYPNLNSQAKPAEFKLKENLLLNRAHLKYMSDEITNKDLVLEDPGQSHSSSRLTLAYQVKNAREYGQFEYRFALHDLQDPQYGLPRNSQLEFFNFRFQIAPNEFRFDSFELFKVLNLNPLRFFEKKASWGFELGTQNKEKFCDPNDSTCLLSGITAKYGYSVYLSPDTESAVLWGLGSVNLRYGPSLVGSKYYTAPGFEIGLIARYGDHLSFLGSFGREYAIDRDYDQFYEGSLQMSFKKNLNFKLGRKNDISNLKMLIYF